MGEVQPLSYSTLPRGSRIFCREDENGLVVSVPKSDMTILFAIAFVVMTWGLLIWREVPETFVSIPYSFGIYYAKPIAMLAGLLFAGVGLAKVVIMSFKGHFGSIILEVKNGRLNVTAAQGFKQIHSFQVSPGLQVYAKRLGIGMNLKGIGELRIRDGSTGFATLRGKPWAELNWVAGMLNQAIERQRNRGGDLIR